MQTFRNKVDTCLSWDSAVVSGLRHFVTPSSPTALLLRFDTDDLQVEQWISLSND